jgi:hypothetical protein
LRKITSGLPGRPESCPMTQPLIPDRVSSDRNFHSVVFVLRDRLRLITRERVARSNLSKVCVSRFPKRPSSSAIAWDSSDNVRIFVAARSESKTLKQFVNGRRDAKVLAQFRNPKLGKIMIG